MMPSRHKPTQLQSEIIQLINALPIREASDSSFACQVRSLLESKSRDWYNSNEYEEERRIAVIENERKRLAKIAKEHDMEKWVVENVKPGMFVKLSGTRDGHGLRRVISIANGSIVCNKMSGVSRNYVVRTPSVDIIQIGSGYWQVMHDVTTHGAGKVIKVFDETEYKLLPRIRT